MNFGSLTSVSEMRSNTGITREGPSPSARTSSGSFLCWTGAHSLPWSPYGGATLCCFYRSGPATEMLMGTTRSRPCQPSLDDGRASSQKAATKLRGLSNAETLAGPFRFRQPRGASKNLGSQSLQGASGRSLAPSNTRLHLQGRLKKTGPPRNETGPHLAPLSGASRCSTAWQLDPRSRQAPTRGWALAPFRTHECRGRVAKPTGAVATKPPSTCLHRLQGEGI